MEIQCSTEVTVPFGEPRGLRSEEVAKWIAEVPDDIELEAIMGSKGHQLDPVPYLRGLRATWKEER
jgi:hypothetical protein